MGLVFVDVEAGPSPSVDVMTEFGCVRYPEMETFYGGLVERSEQVWSNLDAGRRLWTPHLEGLAAWLGRSSERPVMVSDNPAFDFQWVNFYSWLCLGRGLFGHSARRISDYYAGLSGDWRNTQKWKQLRVTPHDHNPVHDALGNAEAFARIQAGER